jgi:integrase
MGVRKHSGKDFRKPFTPVGTAISSGKDSKKPRTPKRASTPEGKKPLRLNNKFVGELTLGEMWWDDDPKASGFGVRSYRGGGKSFFIDYRIEGRQRRFTIGPFPRWSADAARERAKELRIEIDRGIDPAGVKRERREAATVQDLIDRYIKDHLPTKTVGEPRINDEKRMLEMIGQHLGKHAKVADIHDGDIREMHRSITASRGPVRANRVLAICSKMFSLSLSSQAGENTPWRNAEQGNPCKGVARNHEEARDRYFSKSELERIADALADYPGVGADCIRLVMLTGCRPGEAMQAKWSEFEKPGSWVRPSAHVKQRKKHEIPLSPPAVELIDRLRKKRKGEWVFPGDKPGEHLAAVHHVWTHVREHAQLAPDEQGHNARPYDLRHTFASLGVGGGLNLPIIGRLLGHTQARTTQRYAHSPDDALREATNKIGAVIDAKTSAEIVTLRK